VQLISKPLALVIIFTFWLIYNLSKSGVVKLFSLILTFAAVILFTLYFTGIFSSDYRLDRERIFFINNNSHYYINRFSEWSVYLPYRFRPVVFGSWILIVSSLGRVINYFWFDKATNTIGFLALIPFLIGLLKSKKILPLLIMLSGVSAGSLSRNPDTSTIYFLLLPFLLTYITIGLKYLL
jgi:hypothetical protein